MFDPKTYKSKYYLGIQIINSAVQQFNSLQKNWKNGKFFDNKICFLYSNLVIFCLDFIGGKTVSFAATGGAVAGYLYFQYSTWSGM